TNLGRALLLLQETGLIQLKDNVGLLPRSQDIIKNNLDLKIIELEAPQLPRTLDDDKVILAVINNNFAASNGLTAKRDGIFVENGTSPYVNIMVSLEDYTVDESVISFTNGYVAEEVASEAEEVLIGGAMKGW